MSSLALLLFLAAADPARLNNDAARMYRQGKFEQAERMYLDALAASDDQSAVFRAKLHSNLAAVYKRLGRYTEAEARYRTVCDLRRESLGADHPDTAVALNNLAEMVRILGRYDESRALFERALYSLRQAQRPPEADIALVLNNLAEVHRAAGRYALAERQLRESLEIKQRLYGSRHIEVALALNNLAQVREDAGDQQSAEQLLLEALELWNDRPEAVTTLANLARLYVSENRPVEAADYLSRGRQFFERSQPGDPLLDAAMRHTAGQLALQQGRTAEALDQFRTSLTLRERLLGPVHPVIAPLLIEYARALRVARKRGEAARMESRAWRIVGSPQNGTIDVRALRLR